MKARHPFSVRASQRLYHWMLRAFPRTYRAEFGEPMEQLFRDCSAEYFSKAGYVGLAGLWWRSIWDFAYSLAREYGRRAGLITTALAGPNLLTRRARQVLGFARKEAARLKHGYFGTEHVLLGLLVDRDGVAATVLAKMDVDLNALRSAVGARVPLGGDEGRDPFFTWTPRMRRALMLARKEARCLGRDQVGPGHMLLGLIGVEDSLASILLKNFGVDLDRSRAQLMRHPDFSTDPSPDGDRTAE